MFLSIVDRCHKLTFEQFVGTCVSPKVLAPHAKDININADIMTMYLDQLLPGITTATDDGNYGSAACYDVLCLQALSKRIHYGVFDAIIHVHLLNFPFRAITFGLRHEAQRLKRCDSFCSAGKFVAEAKFRSQRSSYLQLIQQQDTEGIMDALTDRAVELKVLYSHLLEIMHSGNAYQAIDTQ